MVRLFIPFQMEIWFGMGRTFLTNKKESILKDSLLDLLMRDIKTGLQLMIQ